MCDKCVSQNLEVDGDAGISVARWHNNRQRRQAAAHTVHVCMHSRDTGRVPHKLSAENRFLIPEHGGGRPPCHREALDNAPPCMRVHPTCTDDCPCPQPKPCQAGYCIMHLYKPAIDRFSHPHYQLAESHREGYLGSGQASQPHTSAWSAALSDMQDPWSRQESCCWGVSAIPHLLRAAHAPRVHLRLVDKVANAGADDNRSAQVRVVCHGDEHELGRRVSGGAMAGCRGSNPARPLTKYEMATVIA